MATFTTEGIVLKRSNFGEADRILTVITPYRGKIKMIAKGVRRITSRRAGNIELLNKVKLHIFQGSGLSVLTEADSLEVYANVKENLFLSAYGSYVSELIDRLVPEEQTNPEVYNLLAAVLDLLNRNSRQIFVRAFEVKILTVLGFWSASQVDASDKVKELLQKLTILSWGEINLLSIDSEQAIELERILRYYIENVIEGKLKSVELIENIRIKI